MLSSSQSRPFGVAMLFAGVDKTGSQLYHMDPSGTFLEFGAKAIGSGSEGAQQSLQESYHKVSWCRHWKSSVCMHLKFYLLPIRLRKVTEDGMECMRGTVNMFGKG